MAPYLEEALDYTKTDGTELKPLIVQIPAWNFTISNEYFSQLFYVCEKNRSTQNLEERLGLIEICEFYISDGN